MKRAFTLLLTVIALNANAQIVSYFINKECRNTWDNSLNAWTGWSAWAENNDNDDHSYALKISPNAVQFRYEFSFWSKKQDKLYLSTQITTYTFLDDVPGTVYPLHKNVSISTVVSSSDKDDYDIINTTTYTGTGRVYSKLTLAQLLGGNAAGETYMYRDLGAGGKGFYGAVINKESTQTLAQKKEEREQAEQDRLDEIEEAKAAKKRKEAEAYKNLGKVIGTLLRKKN